MLYHFGLLRIFFVDLGYGFILVPAGRDLFCHREGFRHPKPGSHEAYLPCSQGRLDDALPRLDPGTEIVYRLDENERGPIAINWSTAEEFRNIQASLDSGEIPLYRVVLWSRGQKIYKVQPLWKGRDLSSPNLIEYPIGITVCDRTWFQIFSGKDWINCPDPRLPQKEAVEIAVEQSVLA